MSKFAVVVLAAGQGKRMGEGAPKVLRELLGRPMVSYLIEAVQKSQVVNRPVVVVSPDHNLVQEALGDSCDYVIQTKQLGTGHATSCARPFLQDQADKVIVLYGDHPLIRPETILNLKKRCEENHNILSLFTTEVEDFEDWRSAFYNFGRIIRDAGGKIKCIREKRDATPAELEVKEINPGLSCYDANWLWSHLDKLDNKNAQGEFYLTDLIKMAIDEGGEIITVKVDPRECLGINTLAELEVAKKLLNK